jgi:transposase InsO family protein
MTKRRTHSPEFKARVAMEAISGRKTLQEIAADHALHPIQVSQWKKQLLEGAGDLFSKGRKRLQKEKIRISWSGRKRCFDNILVERLWRTVKHEEVYIRAYADGWDAEIRLARFIWRYCHVRPHRSLGGRTPYVVYTETASDPSCSELAITEPALVQ